MRKLNFAEEQGSGYDKVVSVIELYGLPPIGWRSAENYFCAILYIPKQFKDMEKNERIEAIFQQACLNYVVNKKTNNESIRERFRFKSKDSTKVYRLIREAIDKNRIKCANPDSSRRDWYYVPYWA